MPVTDVMDPATSAFQRRQAEREAASKPADATPPGWIGRIARALDLDDAPGKSAIFSQFGQVLADAQRVALARRLEAARNAGTAEARKTFAASAPARDRVVQLESQLTAFQGDKQQLEAAHTRATREAERTVARCADPARHEQEAEAAKAELVKVASRITATENALREARADFDRRRDEARKATATTMRADAARELQRISDELGTAVAAKLENIERLRAVIEAARNV